MSARKTIGVVVGVIVAALLCAPAGASAQKPRAELPTYEFGEQWFRSDGLFELTRIDAASGSSSRRRTRSTRRRR